MVGVVVVVGLALAERVPVGDGIDRRRNVGLFRKRREGIDMRRRREGLGRRDRSPLVREWREREGGRKAGKNECRDDFQLHIVSFFVILNLEFV